MSDLEMSELGTPELIAAASVDEEAAAPKQTAQDAHVVRADDADPQAQQRQARAEEELAKELARREKLCEQMEDVALTVDVRQGIDDIRRLQNDWNNLRRWHDPREDALFDRFETARREFFYKRDVQRENKKAAKTRLVTEAERIALSDQWNSTAERLQAIVDEWKTIGSSGDRDADDELWKRLGAARKAFSKRRSDHYKQLDAQRAQAKAAKEGLVAEAEKIAAGIAEWSDDQWRAASNTMRDLMDRWKAAGAAGREDNDRLWEQFQAARQPVFDAQRQRREAIAAAQKRAAAQKQELIQKANELVEKADFGREATEAARQLDRDWKQIGNAGKEANDRLWAEFSEAKEKFWDARRTFFDERHAQWVQRTKDAIERRRARIVNLQEQVDRLQDRLNHALATDRVEEMQDRLDERKETLAALKEEVKSMEEQLEKEK